MAAFSLSIERSLLRCRIKPGKLGSTNRFMLDYFMLDYFMPDYFMPDYFMPDYFMR